MDRLKKEIFFWALVLLAGGLFYFRSDVLKIYRSFPQITESAPKIISDLKKEISAPAPLRTAVKPVSAVLTRAGVINWTNTQRKNNGGFLALKENLILDAAAEAKLKDMFKNQYFEHVSPSGIGPGELVESVGYDYIASGENLALGNFDGDRDLVQAWMDSPGHRANILNTKYQEMGVAVGKGIFEGHETWLAVQEFGKPISACPSPDETLKTSITSYENKLDDLRLKADALRQEIEASDPNTKEERRIYNQKVDEYNALVRQINSLIDELKVMISNYNSEVQSFSACAAS
ncbi:hypothetical protein A2924_00400 [Candidatus Giovannonibacteria bacterium RIFCSPLOWO2_01_FULL_44_16]|uniref:SCP domain-containing protein n=1 Tax=Candidatus Giovannonibacteria bacterium RIFCSPLOWO2_01_FULL_44_16 TaxID=1798348 RepID=A0A1F5X2L7_9BACT|nr:MAG: hypothetical protein A2924_00400 [Candidatus Giovannonibacteria bacterium RIFCSPLOWO2_01_FULL_44_16]